MRGLLVCAIVLALGLVNADSPCVCHYGGRHGSSRTNRELQDRIDAQTARISRLSAGVQELQSRLESGTEKRDQLASRQSDISNRLHDLESQKCGRREFYCGESDNNCVGQTVVCDKKNDCPSGADEESNRCTLPCESGSVFKGGVYDDKSLCTTRRINFITIEISSVRRYTWFKSRVLIDGYVHMDHSTESQDQHGSLALHGHYNFASQELIFDPPEDDRLGIVCHFDGVHNDHAHCYIKREATLDECLHFYVERQ